MCVRVRSTAFNLNLCISHSPLAMAIIAAFSNLENELRTLISITQTHQTIPFTSHRSIGSRREEEGDIENYFLECTSMKWLVYSPFWWNLTTNVINPLASAQPRTILLFTFSIRLSLFFFFRGFDQSSSYAFIKKRTEAQNNGKLIFLFHRPMPSSYCVIYFSFCCNANVRHWNEKDDFAWKYLKWRKSIHNNKTKKWDPYLQPLRIVSGDSDVAIDFICGHA